MLKTRKKIHQTLKKQLDTQKEQMHQVEEHNKLNVILTAQQETGSNVMLLITELLKACFQDSTNG